MPRKDRIDLTGAVVLASLSIIFAFNQISIKYINDGFQPIFGAALRSVLAAGCIWLWMRARGHSTAILPGTVRLGLLLGLVYAAEFVCIFLSLDHTTVTRGTVILYTMPMWMALIAHFVIPGERMTPRKAAGLALAFGGMALAVIDPERGAGGGSIAGDALMLGGALLWACLTLLSRTAGARGMSSEMQVLWMQAVSVPVLLVVSFAFGPFLRDPTVGEIGWLVFAAVVVVAGGFMIWFSMLAIYPASGVASFTFLTPVLGLVLAWAMLGEPLSLALIAGGALVLAGLVLVNRPGRQVPQKVRRTT